MVQLIVQAFVIWPLPLRVKNGWRWRNYPMSGLGTRYQPDVSDLCHNCPADNLDKCHMSFDILQPVIAQCGNLALLNSLHGLNQPTRPYSWLNELPSILFQKLEKKTNKPPPPRNVDLRFHFKQYFGIILSEVEKPETNFPPPPAQIQQRQLTDPFSGS